MPPFIGRQEGPQEPRWRAVLTVLFSCGPSPKVSSPCRAAGASLRLSNDGRSIHESDDAGRVSYFDALRFVNWLHNGQGDGDTEAGAYTLFGGTPTPSNPLLQRNPEAVIFLPTDAEWYKAAYYDTALGIYYDYPAGTDDMIACSVPTLCHSPPAAAGESASLGRFSVRHGASLLTSFGARRAVREAVHRAAQ